MGNIRAQTDSKGPGWPVHALFAYILIRYYRTYRHIAVPG